MPVACERKTFSARIFAVRIQQKQMRKTGLQTAGSGTVEEGVTMQFSTTACRYVITTRQSAFKSRRGATRRFGFTIHDVNRPLDDRSFEGWAIKVASRKRKTAMQKRDILPWCESCTERRRCIYFSRVDELVTRNFSASLVSHSFSHSSRFSRAVAFAKSTISRKRVEYFTQHSTSLDVRNMSWKVPFMLDI